MHVCVCGCVCLSLCLCDVIISPLLEKTENIPVRFLGWGMGGEGGGSNCSLTRQFQAEVPVTVKAA